MAETISNLAPESTFRILSLNWSYLSIKTADSDESWVVVFARARTLSWSLVCLDSRTGRCVGENRKPFCFGFDHRFRISRTCFFLRCTGFATLVSSKFCPRSLEFQHPRACLSSGVYSVICMCARSMGALLDLSCRVPLRHALRNCLHLLWISGSERMIPSA